VAVPFLCAGVWCEARNRGKGDRARSKRGDEAVAVAVAKFRVGSEERNEEL